MSQFRTSADIKTEILEKAGEPTNGNSAYESLALTYLNKAHQAIVGGGSLFSLVVDENWAWARAKHPIILELEPAISGSVTVTNGSRSITFANAPAASVQGWHFKVDNEPTVYKIAQHTAASTAATLDSSYVGDSGVVAFKAFKLDYILEPTYIIVDSRNDKIDISEVDPSVQQTVTLTHGTYTPSEYIAHIVALLNALPSIIVYSGSYDPVSRQFSITSDLNGGAVFRLLGATGTNRKRSALPSLGLDRLDYTNDALIPFPGQVFTQDFSSDVGFTYDNTKVEFVGGVVRQKNLTPTNATFRASLNTYPFDGIWGNGVLTASLVGSPTVDAIGKFGNSINLKGDTLKYLSYPALGNADSNQTGTIEFWYKPNYSGAPTSQKTIVSIHKAGTVNNRIHVEHASSSGALQFRANDSGGGSIFSNNLATWSPTAGQWYHFSVNYDITTGASRVFVDGVQSGGTGTGTGTRALPTDAVLVFGTDEFTNTTSDGSYDDIIVYSTVQRTANFTPPTAPYLEYIYAGSTVVLPPFSYMGAGALLEVNDYDVQETNNPHYIVGGLYWNGSAWVASDGSYAQANISAVVLANLTSLAVEDALTIIVKVVFPDQNIQASVDLISVTATGQKHSPDTYTSTYIIGGISRLIAPFKIFVKNCRDPFIYSTDVTNMELDYPLHSVKQATPVRFARIEETNDGLITIRFNSYPAEKIRVEIPWIPVPHDLQDNDASIPLIPRKDIDCLIHAAAAFIMFDKEDSKFKDMLELAGAALAAMQKKNRSEMRRTDATFGEIIPRQDYITNRRRELRYGYEVND